MAIQSGLPVVGAVTGGVSGSRNGGSFKRTLVYAGLGYTTGWFAQKVLLWAMDQGTPALPEQNAALDTEQKMLGPSNMSDEVVEEKVEEMAIVPVGDVHISGIPSGTVVNSPPVGQGIATVTPLRGKQSTSPLRGKQPMSPMRG